jgi:hypothetical protein
MLFDDDEQLEVRHVVSLAHHDISVYSGEPVTPEGELWIKRNAICLSRRADGPEMGPDSKLPKPFYLFSENCSAKEDFYFALLRNQEQTVATENKAPTPIQYDVKNIISLVQKLHSSEDHMQTRWLNAMIGRIFLGVHKTKDIENSIREKLTKKISRVNRPSFLSNIAIKAIDTGDSAPYFTNLRLKDLSVEGECCIEADMRYTGNFRLEVAATVRIDLGSRFKAREVNLVLAVVLRKLEGHALFKVKPPPSNRIWFSFQQMPKIEMTIEPIVSSRQITYTVILRQIENRIKEVIAETLVLPFWDDTPFFSTEHKKWRGGIFHDDTLKSPSDRESAAAQKGDLDEVERLEETHGTQEKTHGLQEKAHGIQEKAHAIQEKTHGIQKTHEIQESDLPQMEKSHSVPVLEKKPSVGLFGKKLMSKTSKPDLASSPSTSAYSVESKTDTKSEIGSPPVLSAPFTQPASPTVVTVATNADQFRPSSSPPDGNSAAVAMATLTATPQPPSPAQAPNANAFKPYITSKSSSHSSNSSREATDTEKDADKTPQARRNTVSSAGSHSDSGPRSPTLSTNDSFLGPAGPISRGLFARRETASSTSSGISSQSVNETHKRNALNAVASAAASAKRWGLNAFQRRVNDEAAAHHGHGGENASKVDLSQPMGRGHPLPPPGTPLPMPEKKTPTAPIHVPKRKSIPSPILESSTEHAKRATERSPKPPPLPTRRQHQREQDGDEHNMLVVAAPADSEPTTPLSATHNPLHAQPWAEEAGGSAGSAPSLNPEDTIVAEHVGLGVSLLAAVADEGQPKAAGTPEAAADDEDYSAWMDEMEMEDPSPPSSTQPDKVG